jgi:RHS repeat-associated protein
VGSSNLAVDANIGKRATMTDASGTTTYSYDHMDRLTSKATPEGTLRYTYDAAGNLASIASSNANGASMSFAYDGQNRLQTVVDSHLGTTTYTYDGASNVATVTYPNSVAGTYMYDKLNRVTGLGYSNQSSSYVYGRDNAGRLTSASEPNGRAMTWSFDGINRLTGEIISSDPNSQNNGSVGYDLDPVGNRLSETSSLTGVPSGSWNYNADDEQSSETYDQNGNVTAEGGKTFSYDSQNELVSMNGTAVQIVYDGDGNRVSKTVTIPGSGTTTTYYLVDDLNPTGLPQVMDELTNGAVTRTYTYGLQRISEDQLINNTWTPSFYSYDGMGSVRQLTNMAGAVTDTYEYDAFGNLLNSTGTTPNVYMYRGEAYDSDLGLYYLRARWMNPLTGRFMSRDPEDGKLIDPLSFHKYLYADGDPVNVVDPKGQEALAEYEEGSIGTYDELESAAGKYGRKGLENHHLIPQSLNCLFDVTAGKMLAIAILPGAHDFYDQEWNDWWGELFGYQTGRSCADQLVTLQEVFAQAYQIYAKEPDILAAVAAWEATVAAQEADGDL